jgi:glycosyltransferase involved in cell wall biosynthesis
MSNGIDIAVIVPCYDEAATIAQVVADFRAALPQARIVVCDNNSRDATAEIARAAGAEVRRETLQGKGNAVRRMFADIDADLYVLVDGDATYDAASAPMLVEKLLAERLDMVVGVREATQSTAYRAGHAWGNKALSGAVSLLFGTPVTDMLSGYRVLSRRFAKSFPVLAAGFEIETELTVHALVLRMPTGEARTPYGARPIDSPSKLSTWKDGLRIGRMILRLLKDERPLPFFSAVFAGLAALALAIASPVFADFIATGLVPRLPTAVLAASVMLLAFMALVAGFILDNVTRGRRELRMLAYLAIPGPDRRG